jgi:uncharacterized protein (TIGR02391 family)
MSSNASDTAVKWLVAGAVILGFLYTINKLIDKNLIQGTLPDAAKDFASMPRVSPTNYEDMEFHPEIKKRTETAFKSGDYSGAVRHAALAFFDIVRNKSGVNSDGIKLIQAVFRGKNPVLTFKPSEPTHIENSKVGVIDIMEGFTKAVRNKHMHAETEVSEQEAILEINIACFLAIHVENNSVLAIEKGERV